MHVAKESTRHGVARLRNECLATSVKEEESLINFKLSNNIIRLFKDQKCSIRILMEHNVTLQSHKKKRKLKR